ALGTPKLWITLWFMLLVYYNFNIQGTLKYIKTHPYRVTNMNYIRLRLIGIKNNQEESFDLMMVLAGYTELPTLEQPNTYRLNINVTDTTDAFWLVELLKHELSTQTVDNHIAISDTES
ncbi:hypothetical protein, partial [Glaesserella parasuis]|uniref:hypothetical protein n=2 Tax=Glaesserella parasuis TaxID=738 RepID=UPI001BE4C790